MKTDNGIEEHGSLPEAEVEKIAAEMREDIAAGRLSAKSYVTKYDFKTREITALVGQVPTAESPADDSQVVGTDAPLDAVDDL